MPADSPKEGGAGQAQPHGGALAAALFGDERGNDLGGEGRGVGAHAPVRSTSGADARADGTTDAVAGPMLNVTTARAAAYAADDAYSAELRRVFGKEAGDARYDARGESTPELRRLAAAKLAADAALREIRSA